MEVYVYGVLCVSDGRGQWGPNLEFEVATDYADMDEASLNLWPREVEDLRDALTEWLQSIGREAAA